MLPMLTLFTFSTSSLAETTAYIGTVFTDAKVLILLAIGIPLAFFVIRKVLGLMPKK
ncbi:unnamed protein product [marine sediment metagenome]|uniref:Uncharacterized protein n=1 Tax=marine sediment metagenome TaxID=412755 RepID=X1K7R5_9ZZZZ